MKKLEKAFVQITPEFARKTTNASEMVPVASSFLQSLYKAGGMPTLRIREENRIGLNRLNIMQRGAWDASYDNNIHLLKPIKAQGTLENKIILAQFIALFQTMAYFQSGATRFPFVVDSPRGNEASSASSKDILTLITKMDMLPQIILATTDCEEFGNDLPTPANTIILTEQRKLLSDEIYGDNCEEIEALMGLLKQV